MIETLVLLIMGGAVIVGAAVSSRKGRSDSITFFDRTDDDHRR